MRIWSVHPRYLDRQALIACWRETLLAQKVLCGETKGYTRHPQLQRFQAQQDPVASVGAYLEALASEADARGYRFDRTRICTRDAVVPVIDVTDGQMALEWAHLRTKLAARSPEVLARWADVTAPAPHPSFRLVAGPPASWERAV
ncbi:pyrimidine dimer DNA glycosylase/endonuclease V [Microbacterium paludicola]|uniref:pyrimidine dimer DNA glycosylase/endonuclease V n=1 Tax=Microbacterium paludicola TaxID=300019 RepID=UPI0011A1808C|nr:pyrimidine dimer DNA glycosylase/endonuclease V [Microbacterium paludicola]